MRRRWPGVLLLALGLALLGAAGAYWGHGVLAESRLSRLEWQAPSLTAAQPASPPSASSAGPLAWPEITPVLSYENQIPDPSPEAAPLPEPTPTPVPTPTPLPPSDFRLAIPLLDIEAPIQELSIMTDKEGSKYWDIPLEAAGHLKGSAYPGQGSNIVIAGHMRLREDPGLFNRLPDIVGFLKQGTAVQVILTTPQGRFVYRVVRTRVVEPWQTEVMAPTPTETLTLITCVPDWWYTQRLIVTAEPVPAN